MRKPKIILQKERGRLVRARQGQEIAGEPPALRSVGKFLRGLALSLTLVCFAAGGNATAQDAGTNSPAWLTQPLSLMGALNTALQQNAAILKGKNDLEASYGIVVQTRAIALPQVQATGKYTDNEITTLQEPPIPGISYPQAHQDWNAGVQIVQSIYDGGKLTAAVRAARLTKEQALAQYQTVIADALLAVRVAYYDVLLAAQQITVHAEYDLCAAVSSIKDALKTGMVERRTHSFSIQTEGSTAWVIYRVDGVLKSTRESFPFHRIETAVLVRKDDGWKVALLTSTLQAEDSQSANK